MENGATTPDNNNTLEKNKNGSLSPEPDTHTLYSNATHCTKHSLSWRDDSLHGRLPDLFEGLTGTHNVASRHCHRSGDAM